LIRTHALVDAPIQHGFERLRVVFFSHGLYGIPEIYTTLCEDAASHGFVVVAMRHTDGSSFVMGPNGAFSEFHQFD
jgi:alpha-beta hydrolase superfamily lysophospholipase